MSLLLTFEVDDAIDDIFDSPDDDDNFGSWYFIFVFARWSSLTKTSLFLTFELVDETDGDFDAADSDDGDNAEKETVDDREDTVDGVETTGDISCNIEPTAADTFLAFLGFVDANLPTVAFLRGGGLVFAMVAMNNEVLVESSHKKN